MPFGAFGRHHLQPRHLDGGLGQHRQEAWLGDDENGPGVDDRIDHLGGGKPDIQQFDNPAQPEHREHGLDEFRPVRHQDADNITWAYALAMQARSYLVHGLVQLAPAVIPLVESQGEPVRHPPRPETEQLGKVLAHRAAGQPDGSGTGPAGRCGFGPVQTR